MPYLKAVMMMMVMTPIVDVGTVSVKTMMMSSYCLYIIMAGLTVGMSGYVLIPNEYVHSVPELVIVLLLLLEEDHHHYHHRRITTIMVLPILTWPVRRHMLHSVQVLVQQYVTKTMFHGKGVRC